MEAISLAQHGPDLPSSKNLISLRTWPPTALSERNPVIGFPSPGGLGISCGHAWPVYTVSLTVIGRADWEQCVGIKYHIWAIGTRCSFFELVSFIKRKSLKYHFFKLGSVISDDDFKYSVLAESA